MIIATEDRERDDLNLESWTGQGKIGGRVNLISNDSAFGRLNAALLAGAFGAAMAAASPANAMLMLSVDDGVSPSVVFTDNVGADFDSRLGVLGTYVPSGSR